MEWMPIETAPKDGTWILSYGCVHQDDFGEFWGNPTMHSTKWLDGSGWISPHMGGWEPSYWLPLPYPPSVHASDYAANISAQLAATRAQHGDAFAEAVSTALDDNKQQGLGGKQPPPLRFSIGNLVLQKGREGGKIWIETERGEGGDFPIADIEALIREYYDANF